MQRAALFALPVGALSLAQRRRRGRCEELPRHVWVVGAGTIGAHAAYSLARRGVAVTLLDAGAEPASACSLVNAGGLRHSARGLITQPEQLWHLLHGVLTGDPVFQFHWGELLLRADFWRFGMAYCAAAVWAPWRWRNEALLETLSDWFPQVAEEVAQREGIDHISKGFLLVRLHPLPPQPAFAPERAECYSLTADEAVELEPALAPVKDNLSSVLHVPGDRFAHCGDFVRELLKKAEERYGMRRRLNVEVAAIRASGGRVQALTLADGSEIEVGADEHVVVCTGAAAPALLEPLAVRAPIFAMKGYSFTAPVPPEQQADVPKHVIVFEPQHTYVGPVRGGRVRFSSVAEFGGGYAKSDATILPADSGRGLRALRGFCGECMPRLAPLTDKENVQALCGARPQCADDMPMIGRAPRHENLWINVGHGQHGWKQSAGSGELLACQMLGLEPPIEGLDVAALDPARFDAFLAPWRRFPRR